MVDSISRARRSVNMRRIKSKGMKPELLVRSLVHRMGYRYGLHCPDLPGKPDLVLRSRKKVIEVRGCFWHQHRTCPEGRIPRSRVRYWRPKLLRNVQRDKSNLRRLRALGWRVLIIWECNTNDPDKLGRRLTDFLSS
ncbi:MAG: DNA mismatch endonuclease Vsr [Candidatus Sulfotelmatobacter sp.]